MLKETFLSKDYLVSDIGKVYSLKRKSQRELRPTKTRKGYLLVILRVAGKNKGVAVHTLVARAFCKGYKEGLTVNHKDGNKLNNNAQNLEWVSNRENMYHSLYVLQNINKLYGGHNASAVAIKLTSKKTGEIYYFESYTDAARWMEPESSQERIRSMERMISSVVNDRKKSYKGFYIEKQ